MDFTFKKVLPEEVFVSIEPANRTGIVVNEGSEQPSQCANKLSGVEFMDVFACLLWHYPHADIKFYAGRMNLSGSTLSCVVLALSGITAVEWRDRYVNMAARELLEHGTTSISDVAKRLGFASICAFSNYFSKHNKHKSPKQWRYDIRGFNNDTTEILRYKLQKAGEGKVSY